MKRGMKCHMTTMGKFGCFSSSCPECMINRMAAICHCHRERSRQDMLNGRKMSYPAGAAGHHQMIRYPYDFGW